MCCNNGCGLFGLNIDDDTLLLIILILFFIWGTREDACPCAARRCGCAG